MRSCLALTCAIFITGYATSSSIPPTISSREVGESLDLSVFTSDAEIEQCYLQKPNGDTISLKPNDESDEKYEILENMPMVSMCRVRILNLTPNDNGIWTLNAVDLAGQTLHQPYDLTVNVVPEYLPEKLITTTIGREHEISISEPESDVTQSCEITTPNGEKHSLEEASLDNVVKYSSAGSKCGVKITVASEDLVGSWALTARGLTFEKIQPFVVSVKDTDAAAITPPPTTTKVEEGDSLIISVITNDDEVQKCHLTTPNNDEIQFKPVDESDERYELLEDIKSESRCRVKILNLTPADNGQWFLRAVSNGESRYESLYVTVNPAPDTSSRVTYPPSSTTSIPTTINRIEGESFETAVTTFSSKTKKCYLQNPTGTEVQFKPKDESGDKYEILEDIEHVSDCRVRILNLTLHDIGLWTLKAEDSEGTILFQEYDVNVRPDVREEIEVEYLPAQEITTSLGSVHSFSIQELGAYTSETCMIVNPLGKQINLKEDKVEGLELLTSSDFNCGVNITVLSEHFVGNWTLIANGTRFVTEVQRRLPIEISVEMIVPASPNRVVVGYSNNFHVALANPISEPETCKLLDPYGNEHIDNYDMQSDRCAFIVKYVFSWHNGTWTIVYGTRIVYKAFIEVVVVEPNDDLQNLKLRWDLHSRVQQVIGPEDAIYCKVIDPLLRTVFDGFGRCQINIERVSPDHFGQWKMYVSRQGHVLAEEQLFRVVASGTADPRPNVLTHVDVEKPNIYMACTLPGSVNVTTCTFRDPKGRMLLAHSGVTQGRYGYHGTRVSYETRALNHTCGLLITDPINEDVGFWRCAIQTKDDIHYGHINVPTPWFMRDPEDVAQIEKKPRLTAEHTTVQAIVGETVTMSCSIPASFHYCYFRARNGTIYHVAPYLDRYVGAGFEAGECGIRFPSLAVSDSGPWSCHIGFDSKDPDQSVTFDVKVEEALTVTQGDRGRAMRVRAVLNVFTDIRYCVFVRIDGQSFSTQKWSGGYSGWVSDNLFSCELNINDPTPLDRNAWTVIAHLTGGASVQGTSRPRTIVYSFRFPTTWLIVMVAGLSLAMLGAILSPNKNRRWVAARASDASNSFRNSFRRTFRNDVKDNTTAVAA